MTDNLMIEYGNKYRNKYRKKNMCLLIALVLMVTVLLVNFTACKTKKNVVLKPGETSVCQRYI